MATVTISPLVGKHPPFTMDEIDGMLRVWRAKVMFENSLNSVMYQGKYPTFRADLHHTPNGTPYLKEPGVAMIAKPEINLLPLMDFLSGFHTFDAGYPHEPTALEAGAQLCKTAGQLCYLSFGERRTRNENADKYFDNILKSGHGSVLEHANYSLLFYGIDRAVTHELVRHRAGFAYSQVSQRYCDGDTLRFVLRPELDSPDLRADAERLFDSSRQAYLDLANNLRSELSKRKLLQQAARSVLPNCTEAPIIVTGNVRAWRHFLVQRGSIHADTTIRRLAIRAFLCLNAVTPLLFKDFQLNQQDDTSVIVAENPKV